MSSVGSSITMRKVDFDPFLAGELALAIPLTEPQKEIWTSVQMGDESNRSFNESVSLLLRGRFDRELFGRALQEVIGRHEALRMTFDPDGSKACVAAGLEVETPFLDLSAEEAGAREEELARLIRQEVTTPFDLVAGPLIRVRIVRLEPELHQVLLTAHHIVCDGWSIDVLVSDLAEIYSAEKENRAPNLPEPDKFSDYVAGLSRPELIEATREDEEYWLSQYAVKAPVVDLPTDRPRPALRTYEAGRLDWDLPPDLARKLKELGARSGCTFLNVLLAGFSAFIHRLTGQDDIVIGLPAAGQSIDGRDHLVGHCVNLLPLRIRLGQGRGFREYLADVRGVLLDAHDHQRCTFGALMPRMNIARDASRIPLAPVAFNMDQGIDLAGMRFAGLKLGFFSNPRSYDNFEFGVNVSPHPDRFVFECMYNSNLWDRETIAQRMEELGFFLRELARDPDQELSRVGLLPAQERERILSLARGPFLEVPADRTVVDLIQEQARERPQAEAVCHDGTSLSYAELNRRANSLARFLMDFGVGPGKLVGLCLDRSPDMIVAILGVLKAGGAYVPLDPDSPPKRMAYLIEKSGPVLVLADPESEQYLVQAAGEKIRIETGWRDLESGEEVDPERRAAPRDPAYVIFTSGSTGRPKGVLVSHGSLISFVVGMRPVNRSGPGDRVLQFASLWFDTSVCDIFTCLCCGACLVLRNEKMLSSANRFFQFCDELRVTQIGLTTAYLNLLGHYLEGIEIPKRVRLVTFGGEAAGPESVAAWRQRLGPEALLINLYGPTEATVNCTFFEVTQADPGGPVPIGRPQPNCLAYVLDRHLNLCPLGVPGELHLGGPQVALGYLGDPELTRERFIPDPFDDDPGGRLYRSGDMVRLDKQGRLEFLGRADHQVKVRGFRIELGEIQSALEEHSAVRETFVMVREDIPGSKNLTAYLVPVAGRRIQVKGIRTFLKDRLPGYMIPADFVEMEELPIASGGKIDKDALPPPPRAAGENGYLAPADPAESLLAELFAEVLKLKQVGVEDDFFELGGHSLLAVKLITKLEKRVGQSLPVTSIFEAPTVRRLAPLLSQALGPVGLTAMVKIKPGNAENPFFHIGQVDQYVRTFAGFLDTENPVYLLHVQPLEPKAPLFTNVKDIAQHCLREIKRVQPNGPYLLSGFCLGGMVAYEIAQELLDAGEEVRYLALIESYLPDSLKINKAMGPVARIRSRFAFYLRQRRGRGLWPNTCWFAQGALQRLAQAAWGRVCSLVFSLCAKAGRQVPRLCRNEMIALGIARGGYEPRPYPGPMFVFKASETGPWLDIDPTLGWGEYVQKGIKVIEVPGGHSTMYEKPHVQVLAQKVADSLEAV